jgi:redox-sensitive bicupin YhaK (pirin superfamily)
MDNTLKNRSVARVGSSAKRPGSHEFTAANLSAQQLGPDMDPVLSIDHFWMRGRVFAPHPHAGFSAVTYLFEDSEGDFVDRDSLGNHVVAKPGAVLWTVAGRGVMHDEFPAQPGKQRAPKLLFVDGPEVPVFQRTGVRGRVVAGAAAGVGSALDAPLDITFLDLKLEPGAGYQHAILRDKNAFVYVIEGDVLIGDDARRLSTLGAASFAADGDAIYLKAGASGARVVLLAARPLREPVVAHGPFIMNDEQQVAKAVEDYRAGRMGRL